MMRLRCSIFCAWRLKGTLIPANVVAEDDRLTTDDDITASDNETEQNDVASDENIVSGSDRASARQHII